MKSLIALILTLLISCSCGGAQRGGSEGLWYTPEMVAGSVYRIDMEFLGQPVGNATAWKVKDGYVITAAHVCNNGPDVEYFAGGADGSRTPLRVFKTSPSMTPDLCVMTGDVAGVALDQIAPPPKYGEPVFYTGAPRAILFEGLTPFFVGHALNSPYMVIDWAPGASGSPVWNGHGIVGVLVAGFPGTAVSRFVTVEELKEFLE